MNIYSKLADISNFTSAEQILINYILENKDKIMDYSIRKLSKQSEVSISTIYRVLEKLGVSGFSELKLQLSNHWESYQKESTNVDYNFPFPHHSTHFQILNSIKSLYEATVESTFNLIDLDTFLKAVQLINNSENIYLFTSGSNYSLGLMFKENMATLKKKVEIIPSPNDINYYLYSITNKDLVIIVSYLNRGNYELLTQFTQEKNIKSILISSANEKTISKNVDINLRLCPYENDYMKISTYSSKLSVLYLLDCLYSAYFNINYDQYIAIKEAAGENIKNSKKLDLCQFFFI